MSRDFSTATDWRRLRPTNAHAGDQPCVLCGRPTGDCADCTLPAVPGDDKKEPLPAGDAWFVPICPACYQLKTPTPAPAPGPAPGG